MNHFKKPTFFILLLCLIGMSKISMAQITMTSADMPHIGDGLIIVTDANPTMAAGSSGASQAWNFSALHTSSVDTEYMQNPANTKYGTAFPAATVVVTNSQSSYYETVGSTLFALVGQVNFSTLDYLWYVQPQNEILVLPCSFQSQWVQNYLFWNKTAITAPGYDSLMNVGYINSTDNRWLGKPNNPCRLL